MKKRRIWATSPVYYAMAGSMLIMACLSFKQNKILFAVERRVKLSPYPDQARIFGYMSERLINVYCMRHNLKVKYVPVIMPIEDKFVNPSNLRYCYWRLRNKLAFWIS